MDPLLALVADWWWIAPSAVGAGAVGWAGLRFARRGRPHARRITSADRRLALDAARLDVRTATDAVTQARAQVKVTRAEVLRVQAEKAAAKAPAGAVSEARRRAQLADRELRAALAELRARRVAVQAARATMPTTSARLEALPLARLVAEHDELVVRWVSYETDPAKALAFPMMSDGAWPPLETFLREHQHAQWLRPANREARMAPADFAAYRDAVRRATHAFDAAEREARRRAGAPAGADDDRGAPDWAGIAHDLVEGAQQAIVRSAEAWQRAARDRKNRPED